jgi:carbonic anhydrase
MNTMNDTQNADTATRANSIPTTVRNLDIALERNRAFAAAGGHQGANVMPNLGLYVITCLDPRTDPAHFLGLGLGDALVGRNVGGRVTPETIDDIAFIKQIVEMFRPEGPLFEVAVIHHTQCGTGFLADDSFRNTYANQIGVDQSTLLDRAVLDPTVTVAGDVQRVRSAFPQSSGISVSGHIYDVTTGLLETITPLDR